MTAGTRKQIRTALANRDLQAALRNFTMLTRLGRQMGMKGIDFPALQQDLRTRKEQAIGDLPQLIRQFKEKATAAGAVVYEAGDAAEANRYVIKLAKQHAVKLIVKSKSMLSEEIALREKLEHSGIEVVETDIGERIVQLAGERPAHIVGPAIHKTIAQISDLFSEMVGRDVGADPQVLLDTVRRSLRQAYLDADMGISGANIAIAETGSIVILTNEGNGQMVTTLAPIQVAVVGIEKLMHSFDDMNAVLRLLSRSCVGTKMTSYVSVITGVSRADDSSILPFPAGQGPRQVHIILLDNGRNELRDSAAFKEALYCIKCGACLNVCPVFGSLAGHTYGHVYQGGIGTILTAFYHDEQRAHELSGMCMGCMSCKSVCPVGIDTPLLIRELRNKHVNRAGLPLEKSIAYRSILKYPQRLERAAEAGRVLQKPFVGTDSLIRRLPFSFSKITTVVSLPAIADPPLRKRVQGQPGSTANKLNVAFFAGCVTEYAYPDLGQSVFRVLERYGTVPFYPQGQACCGAPAYFSGDAGTALVLARHNIEALLQSAPDYIVTDCPGCAVMLQKEYPALTAGDKALHEQALVLAGKVRDFSQLLSGLPGKPEIKGALSKKVTYHDPCHLKRGLGIWQEPRQLIKDAGYEVVEMNDADACCGFGGDALLTHPELCGSILKRKLDNIEATGADTVITACTACVLQLRGGLDKRNSKIKVVHLAELILG
jgi:iron-sulfur cluster protein